MTKARRTPGYTYEVGRRLRRQETAAERLLWQALRSRCLRGYKFRRQHPLGRYIADFYCAQARLVLELDGSIHHIPDQHEYDRVRTAELQARGLRLLRFTNDDVQHRLNHTLQRILSALPLFTPTDQQPE